MKRIIFMIVVLFLMMAPIGHAATLAFTSVPDTPTCVVQGYIVWANPVGGGEEKNYNIGLVNRFPDFHTVMNFVPGVEYIITVTAYATGGMSGRSMSMRYTVDQPPPFVPPVDNIGTPNITIPGTPGNLAITDV